MEKDNAVEILQRYRRDRSMLLDFILSSSLIKKVVMLPGAVTLDDVDLDKISVDYVLNCARKGEMLELSKAVKDYHDRSGLAKTSNLGSLDQFSFVTNSESSGSPPRREPPPIHASTRLPSHDFASSQFDSFSSSQTQDLTMDDIGDFKDNNYLEETENIRISKYNANVAADLELNLPSFATGITDDDLRETAYEVLLACAGATGGLIIPSKERRKEKRFKLMKKLGLNKNENVTHSKSATSMVGLLEIMRVQMEISETMDTRARRGLLNAITEKLGKRMDNLLIPVELLSNISRTEFFDKKTYTKWQKRQLNMLMEGLVNHPFVGLEESGHMTSELRDILLNIEKYESLPSSTSELQQTECLRSLRDIAIPLAEKPSVDDLSSEVCHWADGYHLNVRLYEKLLLSVFDVLDEGKLTKGVEQILELLKSTWRVLKITETIHYTCYAWVLLRQYVITSERRLLQHAIVQLNKIPSEEQRDPQERLYLKSLSVKVEGEEGFQDVPFLKSFLSPIKKWADKQLGDYHLHFAESLETMNDIVAVAMVTGRLLLEESDGAVCSTSVKNEDQIGLYISSSIRNAFARTLQTADKSDVVNEHPLALIAEESKKLLKTDSTLFVPIFSKRHPKATVISASLLHKLYGNKLKPFLSSAEHLNEETMSVLLSAHSLEQQILAVVTSACEKKSAEVDIQTLIPYQVEDISGTLLLRWVKIQHERILSWVERSIQQEIWKPISPQVRHAASIVEVYRIVEETVDQFFALKVPMRSMELSVLFHGIDNAFQVYTNNVIGDLVIKDNLIPPVPVLTRYKKEARIKAFVKKELFEHNQHPDGKRSTEINIRTTSVLCVQLNTLHYAVSQLTKLEDSIWERWTKKKPHEHFFIGKSIDETSESSSQKETFDGSRREFNASIDRICEIIGTKIVFWDLRDPFIENLYKPSVTQSRLEAIIEPLDMELIKLCDMIVEPLRNRVVTSLFEASLDGLLRILLDGGPWRIFSQSDGELFEEDLEVLKEFFISGGDGLPQEVVENQADRVQHVVKLLGYETRELIEDLKLESRLDMPENKGKVGADRKTVLRILCHRSDSEASRFVKKQYKIPSSSSSGFCL